MASGKGIIQLTIHPSKPYLAYLPALQLSHSLNKVLCFIPQDEFLDVIYWLRQIIAVILGVIWGVAPLKGFLGIAIFCIINAGVLYVYFSSFQQIDEEEYGGTWELTKEGFMTSFALFLVGLLIFLNMCNKTS
uniref:RAB5 interacting factor n=1 Tax=Amphilophus citrinellus TaxID=61819 RepID=A0A3Q0T7A3_AMPCI